MKKFLLIVAILFMVGPLYAADQTVKMAWDANDPAQGVTGYSIFIADSAGGPWAELNTGLIVGVEFEHVFTGDIEQDKFFHVKATDGRNWSEASNIASLMVDTTVPASITTLTISSD